MAVAASGTFSEKLTWGEIKNLGVAPSITTVTWMKGDAEKAVKYAVNVDDAFNTL